MFHGWRLKLREAELAFKHGLLDDATGLLFSEDLRNVRSAQALRYQVGTALIRRAVAQLVNNQRQTGWKSLDKARVLIGDSPEYLAARDEFVTNALSQLESELFKNDAARAFYTIEELERQQVAGRTIDQFKQAAQRIESANRLSTLGKFPEAEEQLAMAIGTLTSESVRAGRAMPLPTDQDANEDPDQEPDQNDHPDQNTPLHRRRREFQVNGKRYQELRHELGAYMAEQDWDNAAQIAEELLRLAPADPRMVEARRKIDPNVPQRRILESTVGIVKNADPSVGPRLFEGRSSHRPFDESDSEEVGMNSKNDHRARSRFLLWVDAVGGFLVCLGDEVEIGQATPGNRADIPILGDISRRHARICRQGGTYIIEPLQRVKIDGRPISEKTLLSDADELELGAGVRLRFRQPHALSATARLEFVSRHRSQPATDAILLMAESCVLGAGWRNHVVCRDWAQDVVIFRQDDGLVCRSASGLEIDGKFTVGRGQLSRNSRIVGADFSMSIEELDKWTN